MTTPHHSLAGHVPETTYGLRSVPTEFRHFGLPVKMTMPSETIDIIEKQMASDFMPADADYDAVHIDFTLTFIIVDPQFLGYITAAVTSHSTSSTPAHKHLIEMMQQSDAFMLPSNTIHIEYYAKDDSFIQAIDVAGSIYKSVKIYWVKGSNIVLCDLQFTGHHIVTGNATTNLLGSSTATDAIDPEGVAGVSYANRATQYTYRRISLASGLTSFVAGDIGKTVTGGTTGDTGTLIAYDNNQRYIIVKPTDPATDLFDDASETCGVTGDGGTGTGTTDAVSQLVISGCKPADSLSDSLDYTLRVANGYETNPDTFTINVTSTNQVIVDPVLDLTGVDTDAHAASYGTYSSGGTDLTGHLMAVTLTITFTYGEDRAIRPGYNNNGATISPYIMNLLLKTSKVALEITVDDDSTMHDLEDHKLSKTKDDVLFVRFVKTKNANDWFAFILAHSDGSTATNLYSKTDSETTFKVATNSLKFTWEGLDLTIAIGNAFATLLSV